MVKNFNNLSIAEKLHRTSLSIVGLISMLSIFSMSLYMYFILEEESADDAKTLSRIISENVAPALMFNDPLAARELLQTLRSVERVTHAEIYDQSEQLFAKYSRKANSKPAPESMMGSSHSALHHIAYSLDTEIPILSLSGEKEQIGTLILHLNLSEDYFHLLYQIAILLLIGLLSLAVFYKLLVRLHQSITTPLFTLIDAMRKVTKKGDYSTKIDIVSNDEIGELTKVYNIMMEELSKRELSLNQELGERRRMEAKLSEIAHFDQISKLPNRHSFNGQIDRALVNLQYDAERFAVLYIDLDNFKYVNDSFGHHTGDLILRKVAERFSESLRKEDFIARLGGDEFAVIIPNIIENQQVSAVAEKLLISMKRPFHPEGQEAYIGASIGIALCPVDGKDRETLQRKADAAMYQAKKLGKNNFQYYQDDLSRTQKNRISIETSLRKSLENDEIKPYYQPIIDLGSQKIVGFETLARWIRNDGKVVGPDDFIPLAEEIGIVKDIGQLMIEASAEQTVEWINRFGTLFCAVNFSTKQFKLDHLDRDVFEILDQSGLHPSNFVMEITESILMDNSTEVGELMRTMIKRGVSIAIDDFGTGYSSLSYLTNFPINKIKIDRSFVAKIPENQNSLAVVVAIIGLSKSLNLKVVAEGIETMEQLTCLQSLGCDYGQGFLFSKPVSAEDATKLLETDNLLPGFNQNS